MKLKIDYRLPDPGSYGPPYSLDTPHFFLNLYTFYIYKKKSLQINEIKSEFNSLIEFMFLCTTDLIVFQRKSKIIVFSNTTPISIFSEMKIQQM